MKKKIVFIVISSMIVILMLSSLIFSHDNYSASENRYLASFPKISLNFFDELSDYLNDHFIFREFFISLNSKYQEISGKELINGVYLSDDNYLIEKYDKSENNEKIIKSLNNFIENNKDIDIEVMIVPTSVVINEDKLPKNCINDEQLNDIKEIYDEVNCECLDVYEDLKKIEDSFYKLDHHWTSKGAYEAYKKYCKVNNLNAISNNLTLVADDFKGTIYNKTLIDNDISDEIYAYNSKSKLKVAYGDNIYDSLYDDSYLQTNDKYAYFLGGNHPLVKITNQDIEGKDKLLIIKDSYANCLLPYLIENYQEIIMVDPRYYGLSIHDLLIKEDIDKVLFLYNMQTLKDDVGILGIE